MPMLRQDFETQNTPVPVPLHADPGQIALRGQFAARESRVAHAKSFVGSACTSVAVQLRYPALFPTVDTGC